MKVIIVLIIFLTAILLICSGYTSGLNADPKGDVQFDSIPPYYTVKNDNGILTDLVVTDSIVYDEKISGSGEELILGNELFSFLCANCHWPNRIFDTTGIYDRKYNLQSIILEPDVNHGKWSQEVLLSLDSFDVAAIQYFIDRYRRDETRIGE